MATIEILGVRRAKCALEAVAAEPVSWRVADTPDGPWAPVAGVHTSTIVLLSSHGGRYVRAETASGSVSEPIEVEPVDGNPNTDWFHTGGYGISHHLISNYVNRVAADDRELWRDDESWDDLLATFDIDRYTEHVRRTGAAFVMLTLGQNSGYLIAPNRAYEQIAGVEPGVRTPVDRDLPMEIADALAGIGVRMMLYLPANPPHGAHLQPGDHAITKAFGYTNDTDGAPPQIVMGRWHSVIEEYSRRYGEKLAGWWFDGVYPHMWESYDLANRHNWASFAAAAKAGNSTRIITFNSGLGPAATSSPNPYVDYSPGETNELGRTPADGRWSDHANGVQWFAFSYLGAHDDYWAGWGNSGTSKQTSDVVAWVRDVRDGDGVVCLDTKVNRFGEIDPEQLAQLEQVRTSRSQNKGD